MKKLYLLLFAMLTANMALVAQEVETTPTPVISWEVTDVSVIVTVTGEGDLHVYVDGAECFDNPIVLQRGEEEYYCDVAATAKVEGCLLSDVAFCTVHVPAMLPAPVPIVYYEDIGECVKVWAEADGVTDVYLFVDGEMVDNPSYYPYGEVETTHMVFAIAHLDGYLDSSSPEIPFGVPALPNPEIEMTCAPTMAYESFQSPFGARVVISPTEEGCYTYYCAYIKDESGSWVSITMWEMYTDPLWFEDEGFYRVEAYSVAPGKLPSNEVAIEFCLIRPTQNYDFVENGIYYKILADGSVGVTYDYENPNGYTGNIVIPKTVTHNGVTYYVTSILESAFEFCTGLTSVTIGDYVTCIGYEAFYGCSALSNVTMGNYVISIEPYAFYGCSSLGQIDLGSGIRTIGKYAFYYCSSLTSVICPAAVPPVMQSDNCFDCYDTATLSVYPAVLQSYMNNEQWNRFSSIVANDSVSPAPGDVDGNGVINITDVTRLIDKLLGN